MKDGVASQRRGTHVLSREGLPEALARSLRQRILAGEFKDGDALVQEAIAQDYEVSRMPVREALRQLEAEGFVETRMHRGAFVTVLPPEEIADLFDVRAVLEADLLRCAVGLADKAAIENARRALRALEAAYKAGDPEPWGRLNWAFHEALYAPARRPQTLSIARSVHYRTERYVRAHLIVTGAIRQAEREHRMLLKLMTERAATAAVRLVREHILNAKNALLEAMAIENVES